MRYLLLMVLVPLCGCAGFWEAVKTVASDPEVQEDVADGTVKVATGDPSGVPKLIGVGVAIVLGLLGYKKFKKTK
jgi:hypothetical protein